MALTNYLFHSVFFLMLFHTFEVFTFDSLDHDSMFMLVVLVWVIQLVISNVWLSRFKQGPVEAMWRRMLGSSSKG